MNMQLKTIFDEFIEVVNENPNYQIALLDANYIVISSTDSTRVGLKFTIDIYTKKERLFEIIVKNRNYGFLWVRSSKHDGDTNIIGQLLVESLKTRILFELNHQQTIENLTLEERLLKSLILGGGSNTDETSRLIQELDFDTSKIRIPVLIVKSEYFTADETTNLKIRINDSDSIYSLMEGNKIIVFKTLEDEQSIGFRESSLQFIDDLIEWGLKESLFLVGNPINNINFYRQAYNANLWLLSSVVDSKTVVFLEDYIFDYYFAHDYAKNSRFFYQFYLNKIDEDDVADIISISDELLYRHDFNITRTADQLFLHKNTLIYKLKKYEELFNLDIRNTFQGKMIFYTISRYLAER